MERAEPFYTLENAVYMSMHNDLSFIIDMRLSLYEHQSTRNPNLPLRFFILLSTPLLEYGKPAYARGAGVPPPRKSLAGVLGIPECMPPIRRRGFRVNLPEAASKTVCMTRQERKRMNKLELQKTANEIRKGIITAVHSAKAGHPGGSLSATEAFTYLYFEEMNIDPADPKKADRDRFVLSKGHTAPGLYSTLAHRGYFPVEDLKTLRHLGSYLQGHPDMKHIPGVDMSSGSLGQGISAAVGMALSAKLSNESYRVYTLLGDGEIEEGQVWEASMFAGARKLDNLVVIVDNNGLQIDGRIEDVCSPYPIDKKFEAFNFHVINVADGNDFDQLKAAFDEARQTKGMPTAIIMHTLKGKGVSYMEGSVDWHGKAPNDEQYAVAMAELEKAGEALCQK